MVKARKRRVPPGGEWVLLAGRCRGSRWTAVVYTIIGDPVAAAIDDSRAAAMRAAMEEALRRARPTRVLVDEDDGVLAALGAPSGPLGDEQEDLVEHFTEQIAYADPEE